jgi:hypothetical protein
MIGTMSWKRTNDTFVTPPLFSAAAAIPWGALFGDSAATEKKPESIGDDNS